MSNLAVLLFYNMPFLFLAFFKLHPIIFIFVKWLMGLLSKNFHTETIINFVSYSAYVICIFSKFYPKNGHLQRRKESTSHTQMQNQTLLFPLPIIKEI